MGGTERGGFDPAKKVEGTKRHLLLDTEGLVLKAKVHSAKVPDEDGIRLLCWSRRASALSAFLTCGSKPDTGGGGQEVGRGEVLGVSVEVVVRKPKKPLPEEVAEVWARE